MLKNISLNLNCFLERLSIGMMQSYLVQSNKNVTLFLDIKSVFNYNLS